jgi:predicted transcriptional regulator
MMQSINNKSTAESVAARVMKTWVGTNDRPPLIGLEDGNKFKTLKRHLAVHRNRTPEAYRQEWGLPPYPMVMPDYSTRRSEMAKESGSGRNKRFATAKAVLRRAADDHLIITKHNFSTLIQTRKNDDAV